MKTPQQIADHLEKIICGALERPHMYGRDAEEFENIVHTYLSLWSYVVDREEDFHRVLSSVLPNSLGAARSYRIENPAADEREVAAFVCSRYREVAEAVGMVIIPATSSAESSPSREYRRPAHGPASPEKTYSVPRRFGIGAVFGVATAFGLLIWVMQLFDAPRPAIVTVAIYLAVVGGVQAVFNKSPRWASIATGAVCALGLFIYMMLIEGAPPAVLVCLLPFVATLGLGVGYCGGAIVAGVFLVMDGITRAMAKRLASNKLDDRSP